MGIHNSKGDWYKTCQKMRDEEAKRVKKGLTPRLHVEKFDGNIKTTPAADKFIQDHRLKYDEKGNIMVSTARGRRRKERLGTT